MKICRVCKIENEDQFIYCKNCGAQLEIAAVAPVNTAEENAPTVRESAPAAQSGVNASMSYNPYAPAAPAAPAAVPAGLVAVEMILPDPANPEYRRPQTVYVTPAQKAAIQYEMLKNGSR